MAGRRPGSDSSREAVLEAARGLFADRGYQATTVRGVAAAAGVSPSMIHHFFATKDELFLASIRMPIDPESVLRTVLDGPRAELPQRLVRVFVSTWQDPEVGPALRSVVRTAVAGEAQAAGLRMFAEELMVPRVARALGLPALNVTAALSMMLGYALTARLLGVEPLASAGVEDLVTLLSPAVGRLLESPAVDGVH
jgi:AcrR family transcriptional regulator